MIFHFQLGRKNYHLRLKKIGPKKDGLFILVHGHEGHSENTNIMCILNDHHWENMYLYTEYISSHYISFSPQSTTMLVSEKNIYFFMLVNHHV